MNREQAVEIIERHIDNNIASGSLVEQALSMAIDALKAQLSKEDTTKDTTSDLPTAQPEPHEGYWIDKGWDGDWAWQIDGRGNCWRVIECSECGKSVLVESNFCPHCGAKMKGERQK